MARSTYYSLLEDLRHNDPKSFRTVLESEGLPQDEHWYDYALLVKAIRWNRKRMVNYLLDRHCRVNRPRRLGTAGANTPLHMVAEKLGWCNIVEKMLRLGARVTDVDADGNTPLHLAFLHHQSDRVVNLLLEHYMQESTEDIRNKDGLGFMHIACTRSNHKSVKAFFDVGMSDIFSQVSPLCDSIYAGFSPLHFAVEAGKHDVANFLCQYEADVYAQDRNGSTPLHLALQKRDAKMIDILFYYDEKNENYVNNFGSSHFMAACAGSDSNVVEQFLAVAADQSVPPCALLRGRVKDIAHHPNAGYSPLHFAVETGDRELVHFLCQRGADVYARDCNGSTSLHLALQKCDPAMIDVLRHYDSRSENCVNNFGVSHFMAACAGSDPSYVGQYVSVAERDPATSPKALLSDRVHDIPQHPNAGYTPLHFACEFGRAETVYGLLCVGAWEQCAATTTTHNRTPYDLAAKQQHAQVCGIVEQYYAYVQQQHAIQQQSNVSCAQARDLVQSCQALRVPCA